MSRESNPGEERVASYAEHAIKAFAMLRNVIRGASSEKGIREYLTLLSICETCKYNTDLQNGIRSGRTRP